MVDEIMRDMQFREAQKFIQDNIHRKATQPELVELYQKLTPENAKETHDEAYKMLEQRAADEILPVFVFTLLGVVAFMFFVAFTNHQIRML